ncbi:MAG TPA: hypothetical protein VLL54_01620 [Pyrinomonadaceae bacterium]|nr:hypothetical protein [Pyrinomonadaceae bacterium]
MVTLLFTAIVITGILALSLYFWAPRSRDSQENLLPPPEPPRGFLADNADADAKLFAAANTSTELESQRASLRERARTGDKTALNEAHQLGELDCYSDLLDQLTADADRQPALFALVSHVTRHELPVNKKLAEAFVKSWEAAPTRSSTATSLHIAALTDDAKLYLTTVEKALSLWRRGLLPEVSAIELKALFDGEFWVLSQRTRSSGAGFVLKRSLANARRELENSARVN